MKPAGEKRMKNNAVLLGTAIVATVMSGAQTAPASTLMEIGNHGFAMMSHSHNSQGYLGVGVREVAEDQLNSFHVPASRGLEIVLIDHDAPAAKAGLKEHDVILRANGELVESVDKFRRMVRETPPGHLLALVISRDGAELTIPVKVANRAEVEKQASEHMTVIPESDMDMSMATPSIGRTVPGSGFFPLVTVPSYYTGVIVDALGPQLATFFGAQTGFGLLVKSVDVNSPASTAGIRAGDVITRVGSAQMATRGDFYKAVRENKGKQITVTLLRDKKEQTVTLNISPGKGNKSRIDDVLNLPEMVELEQLNGDEVKAEVAELQPEIEKAIEAAQAATGPEMDRLNAQMQHLKDLQPQLQEQMKTLRPQLEEQMKQLRAIQPQLQEQMKQLEPQLREQMKALRPQLEEQMKQLKQMEPQLREQMKQLQCMRLAPLV